MTTHSAASIYGIIDNMDAAAITAWLNWHKRLKYPPRFINCFTAAKFDQAPEVLRQIKTALPNTLPVWRGYDGKDPYGNTPEAASAWDDSNFYVRLWNNSATSAQMAAGMWFARRVKPYLSVIRETNAVIMLLNEAAAVFNAPFETECIRLLGEEGIRAAAFRWATGTPDWPDYQQEAIAGEIDMAAKYGAVVGPHEYGGLKLNEQNSLINRYSTLTKRFPADKQPDVFIGEFGLAKATTLNGQVKLDPSSGWLDIPATEVQYMDFISATANLWYLPNKASFSLYCWPAWGNNGSFAVGGHSGLLDEIIEASEWMKFDVTDSPAVEPTPAPITISSKPAEAKIGLRSRIKSIPAEFRNLRADHNYAAAKTGELAAGDIVKRYDIPAYDGQVSAVSMGKWIFAEKLDGDTVVSSGWLWRDRIIWEPLPSSTQEHPTTPALTPEPAPPPISETPVKTRLAYSWTIETTPQMHAIIEQALAGMLMSVVAFGQAMGAANVTLVTEPVS